MNQIISVITLIAVTVMDIPTTPDGNTVVISYNDYEKGN